jgi:hypothetical protein
MNPQIVRIGEHEPHVVIEIAGYVHPEVAEPEGMDLLACVVHAIAPPVKASFPVPIRVEELRVLRAYLAEINSGNGPAGHFSISGGLFSLSFAPSRRGPVLCAVGLKSIERSHVRLEYLVTLEPETITRLVQQLAAFEATTAE